MDTNICVKKLNAHKNYKNVLDAHGLTQVIKSPTRLSDTPSVIDHIMCSSTDKVKKVTNRFQ